MTSWMGIILLAFLFSIALAMIRLRDLFAAVMLSGIFSLISAGLYTLMDAVDVAFTEAAVGAGISTVLMVGTLALTKRREKRQRGVRWLPLVLAVGVGAVLLYGTLDMPSYGDPEAPIHQYMAPRFLEESPEVVGPPNVVTSILASYRGYDTFGETTVVFTAVLGVMLLLGSDRRVRRDAAKGPKEGRR